MGHGITILKPENGILTKQGVCGNKSAGFVVCGLQRVDRSVVAILVLVKHVGVSVRKSTSLDILATQSDVISFSNQRCESKSFSSSPVDSFSCLYRLHSGCKDLLNLCVELFILRKMANFFTNRPKFLDFNTSVFKLSIKLWILDLFPFFRFPLFLSELMVFALQVAIFIFLVCCSFYLQQLCFRDALCKELRSVFVSSGLHVFDYVVHQWLGEGWLV